MFLPDRFVKGTCPKCKAVDQYGDGCEVCGAVYDASELIDPACSLCGNLPVMKNTSHVFLNLENFRSFLEPWVKEHTSKEVSKKLNEWLEDTLQSWCISRDAPYFGFEVPGLKDKFFYVWFDAPVGYISSFKEYCERNGKDYKKEWDNSEIYHCIGKDIVYHHALFWPSMLKGSGFNTPSEILVHGMLKVNGTKMSKSRGTFVQASTYLKHLPADFLRYYLACKMTSGIEDLDLNWDDFCSRVNSDLIGKITNVASRGAQMLGKLDSKIGELDEEGKKLVEFAQSKGDVISKLYEERNFSKAMLEIREIADEANKYFDKYEPWKLVKEDVEKTKIVLTTILNMFRVMAIFLKPILPDYATKVATLFKEDEYKWDDYKTTLENSEINKFKHLLKRVDPKKVEDILDETKKILAKMNKSDKKKEVKKVNKEEKTNEHITIDDFLKVDLRMAKIVEANHVEGADKLLQLTLDLGDQTRNVFSGIKSSYSPEDLVGKMTVVVANLKPRKMKFGVSEGMVLATGDNKDIFLITADEGAKPGQKVN